MRKNGKKWGKWSFRKIFCSFLVLVMISTQCTQSLGATAENVSKTDGEDGIVEEMIQEQEDVTENEKEQEVIFGAESDVTSAGTDIKDDTQKNPEENEESSDLKMETASQTEENKTEFCEHGEKREACVQCNPVQTLDLPEPTEETAVETQAANADGSVTINETNFPDDYFRQYILDTIDQDKNGVLSESEIVNTTLINLKGTYENRHTCASLKGIEYFTQLTYLDCAYGDGNLKELNLQGNTELKDLLCYWNSSIEKIDLSNNTKLEAICVQRAALKSLDVGNLSELTFLDIDGNGALTEIKNLRNCTKLKYLYCYVTNISTLDVSQAVDLEELWCHEAKLSNLDLSRNTKLTNEELRNDGNLKVRIGKQTPYALKMNYQEGQWKDSSGAKYALGTKFYSDEGMTVELPFTVNADGVVTAREVLPITDPIYFKTSIMDGAGNQYTLDGKTRYTVAGRLPADTVYVDHEEASELLSDVTKLVEYLGINVGIDAQYRVDGEYYEEAKKGVVGSYEATISSGEVHYVTRIEVGVGINVANFADETFRQYVKKFDTGEQSGFFTAAELQTVKVIQLGGTYENRHTCASLEGIEFFTQLTCLDCAYGDGNLKELNLQYNTELKDLLCYWNPIETLDLSNNAKLETIHVQRAALKSLDVGNLSELTLLDIDGNGALTEIKNLRNCTKLKYLYCYATNISTLDVSQAEDLEELWCYEAKLSNLDLSRNTKLTNEELRNDGNLKVRLGKQTPYALKMNYQEGQWKDSSGAKYALGTKFYSDEDMTVELPFTVNADGVVTAREVLPITDPIYFKASIADGAGNQYMLDGKTRYTVSGRLPADTVYVDHKEAPELLGDVTKLIEYLGINVGTNAQYRVNGEHYEEAKKGVIGSYEAIISSEEVSYTTRIEVGVSINAANFADETFREYVKKFDTGEQSGFFTISELNQVQEINLGGSVEQPHTCASLQGIEYFRKLEGLNCICGDGNLKELDLSHNTELRVLAGWRNPLEMLDLSRNVKLEIVNVQWTALRSLDVGSLSELRLLDVDCNEKFEEIKNIQNCKKLKELYCYCTRITDIDLRQLTSLEILWCYDTKLSALDLSNNTNLLKLNCGTNPNLTELNLASNPALTMLYCSDTGLKKLDLTYNTALKDLACSNNALTELEVNHLTSLENLECAGNHLTSLDVSQLSPSLTVDAEGQTIEKPLAMSYSNGSWTNVAADDMEPVRSFHAQGTSFYNAADQTQLMAFSVNAQGTLSATKVFDIVDSVSYESTLYDNTGAVRSAKLKGTFSYAPQYTLTAGTVMISSTVIKEKLKESTDLSALKSISGLIMSNPDIDEMKDAVTISASDPDFQNMKAGIDGTYTYTMTLGGSSLTGTITVYTVELETMVIIPATILLKRDYTQNKAVAEAEIKLQSGTIVPGTVSVSADPSVTLTGRSDRNQTIAVDVYDGENQYQGNDALASLTTANAQKSFRLISEDVSALKAQNYTGTMNFTIQYREDE